MGRRVGWRVAEALGEDGRWVGRDLAEGAVGCEAGILLGWKVQIRTCGLLPMEGGTVLYHLSI